MAPVAPPQPRPPENLVNRNGHHPTVADLFPPTQNLFPSILELLPGHEATAPHPQDDCAVFELLSKVAETIGRADLVQEFKQRAQATVQKKPSLQPPSAPVPALVTEGIRLLQEGKLTEAVEKFQQATGEHPDEQSGYGNLGVALARLKRFPASR